MLTLAFVLAGSFACAAEPPKFLVGAPLSSAPAKRTVFLMKEPTKDRTALKPLADALSARGFKVVALDDAGPSRSVEALSEDVAKKVFAAGDGDLYFVGHGAGALVLRWYLAHDKPQHVVRLLMIGPPNHGTAVPQRVQDTVVFDLLWGAKKGHRLAADRRGFWESLAKPPCEFGILAGGTGGEDGLDQELKGDNDGDVLVEEARLGGARDFSLLPFTHDELLRRPRALEQELNYIQTGFFQPPPPAEDPMPAFRPRWREGQGWRVEYTQWTPDPAVALSGMREDRSIWVYVVSQPEKGGWLLSIKPERPGTEEFRLVEECRVLFTDALAVKSAACETSTFEGFKEVPRRAKASGFAPRDAMSVPVLFWPDWTPGTRQRHIVQGNKLTAVWGGKVPAELRWEKGQPWWSLFFLGEGKPGIQARLLE